MKNIICDKCLLFHEEIIRGFCRKCYYALKYKGNLLNVEKSKIKKFSKIENDLLIGSLLGDAYLGKNKTSRFAHLKIERSMIDLEYLKYEFDILNKFCKSEIKIYKRNESKQYCYFITRSYEILDNLFQKWYKDGIKTVPNDIYLNPLIISIWLADDGHISIHHKKQGLLRTTFATNGFRLNEVELLSSLLSKRYNVNFNVNKTSVNNQYVIIGADEATRILWKDIKNVFPKSMSRKYSVFKNESK